MNQPRINPSVWPTLRSRLARYLPAELYGKLQALPEDLLQIDAPEQRRNSHRLQQVIRALEPLQRVLIQYAPRYLTQLDPIPGRPHGEILKGTFIFADVTGFTALTELLSRQGHALGREIMNQIMNRLFASVLDPLIASGGDLLIFAGDAALVYFPQQDQDHHQDVLQAVRAALRMERAILPFASLATEFGQCSLTMSVGVECGQAYAGVVGTERRMELLVSGPGIYGAMAAEMQAGPGQVALGQQAGAIAAKHFTMAGSLIIDDLGDELGDYEISLPTRKQGGTVLFSLAIEEVLSTLEITLQRVERLAPFLPEDMLAHLVNTDRQRKLESEFRPVAVQFINVLGLEELAMRQGAEFATQVFQRYFVRAEEIITQHEGVISQIDAYAQGFFFLNTFGAPKAHEGTTRYAVSAGLQLAQALEQVNREFALDPPLQQRGGLTYGLVFNGEIGAQYRRESVVAGPAVNRAARLMSKAEPGQIILDSKIWAETQRTFVGEPLPAVTLKGIEEPVVIVNVQEVRRGTRLPPLERSLLGRDDEQARLAEALKLLQTSLSGSAWQVTGETGLGKTALMSSLADMVRQQPLTLFIGHCQPHGKHTPLYPWLDLLIGWLDADEDDDPNQQYAQLTAELETLGLSEFTDALANLLALPVIREADKDKASQPEFEHINGPQLVLKLLTELAESKPLVVILEDTHWLDDASLALLNELLTQISKMSLMLIMTGRERITDANHVSSLPLTPLSDVALIEVSQRVLGARTLDVNLAQWICTQAGGNPLYAEELCRALRAEDAVLLDRGTGEARWTKLAPALPLSLHELLLARLDGLPPIEQDVLKRGAVMGVSFEYDGLLKLYNNHISTGEVDLALERVTQASFLTMLSPTSYRFNHSLMQETIYATLSFSQRQMWHTQIGDWLVDRWHKYEQFLELIAYHYLRGSNVEKAARFGRQAGDKARESGIYTGALSYYTQVLGLSDAPIGERIRAAEGQADVLALQGTYDKAIQFYTRAADLGSNNALAKQAILRGDVETLAQLEFTSALRPWADGARAWLLAQAGQSSTALNLAEAALDVAEGVARLELLELIQILKAGKIPDKYTVWLHRFVKGVLQGGISPVGLLDMPSSMTDIIKIIVRENGMGLAEIAQTLSQTSEATQNILDEMIAKGYIRAVQTKQEIIYKARFGRKADKTLSSDIWSTLDWR